MRYCENIYKTVRWKTREITIGKVKVGGDNPVRIQSMTTSNTRDVDATVDQIMRLSDVGCEIARVTVQGKKEAEACEGIKNGLVKRGYDIPLVADIHFYPPAAMLVAEYVDKVRVNPGNFVDRRASFKTIEYNDDSYSKEIEKIEETFGPLVDKCKRLNRAMRIGTNHGSLSDRIMNRYGDTPFGMVESALEFARVCRNHDYHNFLFSMKASNPLVMMQAYRLLVAEMMKLGWDYPLHLGVTEAGDGEDGRVKSAVGTGGLLLDGLGDTIRVSLTEDPWEEIDPCNRLANLASSYEASPGIAPFIETHRDISDLTKREVITKFPLHKDGSVLLKLKAEDLESPTLFEDLGFELELNRPKKGDASVDALVIEGAPSLLGNKNLGHLRDIGVGIISKNEGDIPLASLDDSPIAESVLLVQDGNPSTWEKILNHQPRFIILELKVAKFHRARHFFEWLLTKGLDIPVILSVNYEVPLEDLVIHAATELGAILSDQQGEGLLMSGPYDLSMLRSLSFSILQAARLRSTKTDYIACPGCGRTLFDIQSVTQRIREKTAHLPGVKIAVMGCIVNGPGEMADADFGYVGSRSNMIDLYVGKECVQRNIPEDEAVDKLIDLIKEHDRWVEPKELVDATA